ncbi:MULTISPECIES: AMP-binding protein [Eikenella]|uniref:Uncharacterized protein n=1 Tax=Eikenella longinqua TaxID=1795827 RepID=A0A1A9S0D5_9NEIS|nr:MULTISPECIES: AMP-binding protein [Eikenella]OAM29973.1 hypothetical protein A7P95_02820 [Eikenella longinqua]
MPILSLLNRSPDSPLADNWTAAQFSAATLSLAARLRAHNIQAAALWFDDAARFASALLAAWLAGAEVYLPPNLAEENRRWAEARGAVWLSDVPEVSDGLWLYDEAAEQAAAPSEAFAWPHENVLYLKTSGSSGEAKTIVKTRAQMLAEAAAVAQRLPENWRGLSAVGSVSPQHLYGLTFRVFVPLAAGWAIGRRQCVYPELLLADSRRECLWIASPALLNRLGEGRDWARLRGRVCGIVSAGGLLPEATAALLQEKLGFAPHDVYGSTETGVIALRQGGEWELLPEVEAAVDEQNRFQVASPWSGGVQQTADAVRLHGRRLELLGRQDRIIKLEDKRVSLAQLEHDLLAHAWVADAHCARHPQHGRIAAWTALNEAGIAALREQGRAAVAQSLKRHLAKTQDTAALPRYWRFAAELPRNPQAKIREQDFQTAFTVPQTAPQWVLVSQNDEAREYAFEGVVPLDLAWFGGHFADFPLVPGVIEIQWAMDLAARFDWGRKQVKQMENLKYQHFVRPHDTVRLTLRHDAAKNKIHFAIAQGDTPCASGRVALHD